MRSEQSEEAEWTSRRRLLAALRREAPDRLPVTTHHLMPYFLEKYMGAMGALEFHEQLGMDATHWVFAHRPDEAEGAYADPTQGQPGYLEAQRVYSDDWRIEKEQLPDERYETVRYRILTPVKTLSTVLQSDEHTTWVSERLIKEKSDIDLVERWAPAPLCDVQEVNRQAENLGERGIVRGAVPSFDIYGQPGCWQDAAALLGIEELILQTFYDPQWVHQFLRILKERKLKYVESASGANYDLLELGGGDASTTVISPQIFEQFVAPPDSELIAAARLAGQRIVYHTCGGMMPILDQIADMGPDAMETFTPPSLGGDADLADAKRRIGGRVCLIGGFDQARFFAGCSAEQTRRAVIECFKAAGEGGGYILAPSDHFFDADPELIAAFAERARMCRY